MTKVQSSASSNRNNVYSNRSCLTFHLDLTLGYANTLPARSFVTLLTIQSNPVGPNLIPPPLGPVLITCFTGRSVSTAAQRKICTE